MAPASLADLVSALPSDESWGPPTSTDTTLEGVPYAPYSKGDKLGRMADWTSEGKDGRDGRGGRQQYNRNYRGTVLFEERIGFKLIGTVYYRSAGLWRWNLLPLRRPSR